MPISGMKSATSGRSETNKKSLLDDNFYSRLKCWTFSAWCVKSWTRRCIQGAILLQLDWLSYNPIFRTDDLRLGLIRYQEELNRTWNRCFGGRVWVWSAPSCSGRFAKTLMRWLGDWARSRTRPRNWWTCKGVTAHFTKMFFSAICFVQVPADLYEGNSPRSHEKDLHRYAKGIQLIWSPLLLLLSNLQVLFLLDCTILPKEDIQLNTRVFHWPKVTRRPWLQDPQTFPRTWQPSLTWPRPGSATSGTRWKTPSGTGSTSLRPRWVS